MTVVRKKKRKNEINFRETIANELKRLGHATPYDIAECLRNIGVKQNNGKAVTPGFVRAWLNRIDLAENVINDSWTWKGLR